MNSPHQFTLSQIKKARHALGLATSKVAYRNYYSSENDEDWNDLVIRGFATTRKTSVSPDRFYHLTKYGAEQFLKEGERLEVDLKFPKVNPLEI